MDKLETSQDPVIRVRPRGLNAFLYRISWRCPEWLFYYAHTFLVVGRGLKGASTDLVGYEIRLATEQDANLFTALRISPEMVLARMRTGDRCVIALRDGAIVSMLWAATGKFYEHESGMEIDTGENGYYRYNSLTKESERRKGLYLQCSLEIGRYYSNQGRSETLGIIDIFNVASQIANVKSGTTLEGEVIHWIILGVHIVYYKRWHVPTKRLRFFIGKPSGDFRVL